MIPLYFCLVSCCNWTNLTFCRYDVEENADIFYKEVPDGINVMQIGCPTDPNLPLCVVGGNCSIQVITCSSLTDVLLIVE